MPEVHIDELTLENFGPYYGEHTFDFGPVEDRCGILIGGKNGVGKTHLLRALYLAVVGEAGVGDLKKVEPASEATRFVFEKSLNRRAQAEGKDTVRLQVKISQHEETGGGSRKAVLVREIRHRPNSPPVWRSHADRLDGSGRIEEERHLAKLRDTLLPRHLARFFFFDAERGQNFNLGQEEIVEGISRILGLWSYDALENDLRGLIQNKIPRVFNASGEYEAAQKLADISGQVVTTEKKLSALRDDLKSIELEMSESRTELDEVEEHLKSIGAVDPEELEKAQATRTELAETKAKLEAELTAAWEQAMPVALMGDYRRELQIDLIREEKRREWESSRATVEPKIPQVKRDVFEKAPPEHRLAEDVYAFYADRLEKALHRLFHPPPEGMAESIFITDRNDRSAQIRDRLATATNSLPGVVELCERVESVGADLRELGGKIRQLKQDAGTMELGAKLHKRRGELTVECDHLENRKKEVEQRILTLESELQEQKREETNLTNLETKGRQGKNLTVLAASYREATKEIRIRAAEQLREKISEYVGELWTEITERRREFLGMKFDENWSCWLLGRNGEKSSWEDANTSAGQRQVRMLAFYEALRRLAKVAPPLVVDTPLGRLDKEIRNSVLDRLYLTGHQTIILTTNSEIDPDGLLFGRIHERFGRVYTLHPYEQGDSVNYEVRVSNDYFGRRP